MAPQKKTKGLRLSAQQQLVPQRVAIPPPAWDPNAPSGASTVAPYFESRRLLRLDFVQLRLTDRPFYWSTKKVTCESKVACKCSKQIFQNPRKRVLTLPKEGEVLSFNNLPEFCKHVRSASSYGHFIAESDFGSKCQGLDSEKNRARA